MRTKQRLLHDTEALGCIPAQHEVKTATIGHKHRKVDIQETKKQDLGPASHFYGKMIKRQPDSGYSLKQSQCVDDMLERFETSN